jgi:CRP-like cAMP-binding protein
LLFCEEASLLRYSSDHFDINWYSAGISIIEQGEQANSLYLILSGSVDVIHECTGYVRRVTHDEIADAVG